MGVLWTSTLLWLLGFPGPYSVGSLYRVFTADPRAPQTLHFTLLDLQGYLTKFPVTGKLQANEPGTREGTDLALALDAHAGAGLALNRLLELGADLQFATDFLYPDQNILYVQQGGDWVARSPKPRIALGFGDLALTLKLSLPFKKVVHFAWIPQLWIPVGPQSFRDSTDLDTGAIAWMYKGGFFRRFASQSMALGTIFAVSLRPVPVLGLHLNAGWTRPRLEGDSQTFVYGVGLEIRLPRARLFFEDYTERFTQSTASQRYGEGWAVSTLGLESGPYPGSQFNLHLFFTHKIPGLGRDPSLFFPYKPDYGFGFGFTYAFSWARPTPPAPPPEEEHPPSVPPTPPPPETVEVQVPSPPSEEQPAPPAFGSLGGVVVDGMTNMPLSVELVLIHGQETYQTWSDPATGQYFFDSLPAGLYTLKVELPGYKPFLTSIVITEGQPTVKDIFLTRELPEETPMGTFTGRVYDEKTKDPLYAKLVFVNSDLEPVWTDSATGVFRVDLPVGTYAVRVEAEGYIPQGKPVVIQKDQPTIVDFGLLKKGMTLRFQNIYFESGKATLKPESYPILDEIVKLLKEHPNVIVEIQGHTDDVGSEAFNLKLSQKRAEAVRQYLIDHGIEPDRLIAKGYGESKPLVPNTSPENRAKNRRVEFVILGEKTSQP